MGLFSFIKNAGAKIFGKSAPSEAETAELAKEKANKLVKAVETLGLEVLDLNIEVVGDNATVYGQADSQETKEKVVLVVGNTDGIATVDDKMMVVEPKPEAQFHTVVKGEFLSKIAKKYYGDANKYPIIFEANKPMLTHPDKIYPGQVLRIPALES